MRRSLDPIPSLWASKIDSPQDDERENLTVAIATNSETAIDIRIAIEPLATDANGNGIIYAACLLIFLNVLIISEVNKRHDGNRLWIMRLSYRLFGLWQVVHRTLAALFTAFLSIATLAAMNDRPTMHDVVNWIDSEALLLVFSMMTIVSILMETGIFDYIAVYTFQVFYYPQAYPFEIAFSILWLFSSLHFRWAKATFGN